MRFTKLILGAVGIGAMGIAGAVGCGSSTATGTTTTSTGAGGGGGCALKSSCLAVDKACIGLTSNAGLTKFGLRMSELDVTSPPALASGLVSGIVSGAVGLNDAACYQNGTATFSWLVQFDTQAHTLKTGGAKPVTDPTQGYSFDMETVGSLNVAPITFMNVTPDTTGTFSITTGFDLVVPIFLTAAGTNPILLPLHQARLLSGTLSSNNDCIGTYNAAGLETSNSCAPDNTVTPAIPGFIDGGKLDGYITLKEADAVIIPSLMQSLCVILSGGASMYTMTSGGNTVCKTDSSGNIVYQGGWCSTSNSAATSTCADSEELKADFAASSVKILN